MKENQLREKMRIKVVALDMMILEDAENRWLRSER
jgi:hypothetical protein